MLDASLARVVAAFDGAVVREPQAGGSAPPIREVRIVAAGERPTLTGSLVVAPGLDSLALAAAQRELTAWVEAGAAGVVVRATVLHELDTSAAEQLGAATLIGLSEATPWEEVYRQLDEAVRSLAAPPLGAPDAAVIDDLYAICDALSGSVGGPVVVWDRNWRLLAYSETRGQVDETRRRSIMERRAPSDVIEIFRLDGTLQELYSGNVVRIEGDGGPGLSTRLAVRVHAATELLGSIWIHESEQELGDEAVAALRNAADLAALHLLRRRAQRDQSAAKRREAARLVLANGDIGSPAVRPFVRTLVPPLTVLSIRPRGDDAAAALELVKRMADAIATYLEAYRIDALEAVVDDTLHVILCGPPEVVARHGHQLFLQAQDVDRGAGSQAATGISVGAVAGVPRSLQTAELALQVTAEHVLARPVPYEEVWPTVLVDRLAEAAAADWTLLHGPVERLAASVDEGDRELFRTLLGVFDAGGVVKEAAALLDVHPNTVRYRLRRLDERFGIVIDDPLVRFALEVQARVLDVRRR